ncbi:hypothetical protein RvY_17098 [Ramazzottius varieornatus]|uniref:Small ribosomal subunit protein uS12m n=1 Tax=Ramazzottius varieornatus TaxID=947166 RepID=A0A1D1W0X4_RAMVA|nr:hypothetical protein RvY_17098 [Ramazzottius varieornatus]
MFSFGRFCQSVVNRCIAQAQPAQVRTYNQYPKRYWLHDKPAAQVAAIPEKKPFELVPSPFNPPTRPDARAILAQYYADYRCLTKLHLGLPPIRRGWRFPLVGKPQCKAVVLKTMIKKPKKPNSANRRCVRVRLSTGKEATAHVPGEGHNLQEHSVVLVQNGRTQDLIGVKLKVVRGKLDCAPVKKKTAS